MHGVMQHQRLQRSCGFTLSHLIYQIFKIKDSETGASEEKIDRTLFFVYNLYIIHKQNENKNVLGSSCILGKWEEIQKEKIKMIRILVVEDDEKLNQIVCTYLNDSGFQAKGCLSAAAAYEEMYHTVYQLIISDIMMPGMDGYELIETLREHGYTMPILIITAKAQFEDKQRGFWAGTDDYMVKPIDVNEMVLRVGALLKRARISTERKIVCGNTVLDYDALTVRCGREVSLLPQKEFYLLYKLMAYPNKIFTRRQLMDEIWGMDSSSEERTVDVHINRLRERFKDCTDFQIQTVRGLGYKVVKQES